MSIYLEYRVCTVLQVTYGGDLRPPDRANAPESQKIPHRLMQWGTEEIQMACRHLKFVYAPHPHQSGKSPLP